MEPVYLKTQDCARLLGKSLSSVKKAAKEGRIGAVKFSNMQGGDGGDVYMIPLAALPPKLRSKWLRHKQREAARERREREVVGAGTAAEGGIPAGYDIGAARGMTDKDREEAAKWLGIIRDWQTYRAGMPHGGKGGADEAFIERYNAAVTEGRELLTIGTLYNKQKRYKEGGEAALCDRRGRHEGHCTKITPYIAEKFKGLYLDENRLSVKQCHRLIRQMFIRDGMDLGGFPSVSALNRYKKVIPEAAVLYLRYGESAFRDKAEPYISRSYDDVEVNGIWVGDNHTIDIFVRKADGSLHRPHMTTWEDIKSRKLVGWCLTENPCADATIYAFRRAVEAYGLPGKILTDNGREYTAADFGGQGFRERKNGKLRGDQLTILKSLGVEFATAMPRNARAKPIERFFNTFSQQFAKLFPAYTGGGVERQPESLKERLKDPANVMDVKELERCIDAYITGIYNKEPHRGEGMYNRSPDEVFAAGFTEKRMVAPDKMDLMFMRWSRPLKVGKNGVTLTFYGKKMQYFDADICAQRHGEAVYCRYDPYDLSRVLLYTNGGLYIGEAPLKEQLGYNATKEEVAAHQKANKHAVKIIKDYISLQNGGGGERVELLLAEAARNIEGGGAISPGVIRIVSDLTEMAAAQAAAGPPEADEYGGGDAEDGAFEPMEPWHVIYDRQVQSA